MGTAIALEPERFTQAPPQVTNSCKRVAVFVHGFGSSAACWDALIKLFDVDPSIGDAFHVDRTFGYPTRWFNFSPLKRIPRLQECADRLKAHLSKACFAEAEITLVGHSFGGLVIQAYLGKALRDRKGAELKNIRQAIFIATPHLGSNVCAFWRSLFSRIFVNPQERVLRALNPEIHDVVEEFRQRIIDYPIVCRCFWGMQDEIVPEASGRGSHPEASPLEGDHFSILTPRDLDDPRYGLLVDAIRHPIGHPDVFEVDLFEIELTVRPILGKRGRKIPFGRQRRFKLVHGDSQAEMTHRVTFSRQNKCSKPYKLRYRTRRDGAVIPHVSHPNMADAQELGLHDDHGCDHVFKFMPEPGETYTVLWEVYKGFDAGNRNFHFHFNKPESRSHYQQVQFRLDLTAYLGCGFELIKDPVLYYHPQEPATCDECANLPDIQPIRTSAEHSAGIWEWHLADIRQGVLTVEWDLTRKGDSSDEP